MDGKDGVETKGVVMPMRRLKDKVWRDCKIVIDRLVEQTVDGISTENKTVAYLVTIYQGGGRRTMFRADSLKQLWTSLIEESRICPTETELERIRAKRKPCVPLWKQILEDK